MGVGENGEFWGFGFFDICRNLMRLEFDEIINFERKFEFSIFELYI